MCGSPARVEHVATVTAVAALQTVAVAALQTVAVVAVAAVVMAGVAVTAAALVAAQVVARAAAPTVVVRQPRGRHGGQPHARPRMAVARVAVARVEAMAQAPPGGGGTRPAEEGGR